MSVCKYVSMQVSQCASSYVSTQVGQYASMSVCKYVRMQVCPYASMSACKYVRMQVCQYKSTIKPRYSIFQGTDQNFAFYRGSLYCQHINNHDITSWDQKLYAVLAELCRYAIARFHCTSFLVIVLLCFVFFFFTYYHFFFFSFLASPGSNRKNE